MNREIKVKIWDPVNGMGIGFSIYDLPSVARACIEYEEELEDCIFLEYTGLKDKNGVEIYEGDVLRASKNLKFIALVKFGEYCEQDFYATMANGYYYEWSNDDTDVGSLTSQVIKHYAMEVIGNIYENPELLEQV